MTSPVGAIAGQSTHSPFTHDCSPQVHSREHSQLFMGRAVEHGAVAALGEDPLLVRQARYPAR